MYRYKENKSGNLKKAVLLTLIMIFVAIFSILIYDLYLGIEIKAYGYEENTISATTLEKTVDEKKKEDKTISETIEEVTKCVVGISKIKETGISIFSKDGTSELGMGTGVVVSENGYIVTNWHVCGEKYSNCYVTLENGRMFNGSVVWADTDLDLAIVKIAAKGLNYINIGDSNSLKIAQTVYAIGNPIGFEFQRTVTSGIVSALNRTIKLEENNKSVYMEDLIQTDATINPGNSGGPLINLDGEMIGITTVKISSAEGIGFAIPINVIKPIINKCIKNGNFEEAYLGIFAYDKEVIPYLDSNIEFDSGIYVAQIAKDGPCANTELRVGDIITKIDNCEVNKMSELREYIYTKQPNEEVVLTILRNNKQNNLTIKLGKRS